MCLYGGVALLDNVKDLTQNNFFFTKYKIIITGTGPDLPLAHDARA